MARVYESAEKLVDDLIDSVGKKIVLGLPVGVGKALHVADALYQRTAIDSSISLTIFTGLTLETPRGHGEFEKRFVDPLVDRLYKEWPTPKYATAVRNNSLPSNIQVREFYLRPGAYLNNPQAQQNYTSINYSGVVAELVRMGVNVIAQLVATRSGQQDSFSLSSNPEITLDLLPHFETQRQNGTQVAMVGQVNNQLPYMPGDAEVPRDCFDFVLEPDAGDFPLFALPNRPVSPADYATAMHVASLVRDGGTLQVGIGSLSDAVAHCLRLRHNAPEVFGEVLRLLPGGATSTRRAELPVECNSFKQGLFSSTELLSDALFALFESGIISRFADDMDSSVIHAGFFVGSGNFYERMRGLSDADRDRIRMTRISEVNTLLGEETRKRNQRRNAHFVNETMMATLLGSAVSDALDDGRVVSGVGGQFDFVKMAQDLGDAQSILMVRARRVQNGVAKSNIRWVYGHATVPRHCRDIYVSEYGVASTRGKSDRDVIVAMCGIADSEFQSQLIESAKRARKLENEYSLPTEFANNSPAVLQKIFSRENIRPHFPRYPLGTEFTEVEQKLVAALEYLKDQTARPLSNGTSLVRGLLAGGGERHRSELARMNLDNPSNIKERIMRRMLSFALQRTIE